LRRSRWQRGDKSWLRMMYSPYRCESCDKRFLKLSHRFEAGVLWLAVVLIVLLLIGAVIYFSTLHTTPDTGFPALAGSSSPANDGAAGAEKSLAPYEKAQAGNPRAQYELGLLLLNGEGGATKNPRRAVKWLEQAAKSGSADAAFALGVMYQKGQGALQNFEQALHWFETAAAQNHASAQYSAAVMYRNGMGVPVDLVKAYIWANISAVQGHLESITMRDNLLNGMSPQQISEGQRASREWKPGNANPVATPKPAASKPAAPAPSATQASTAKSEVPTGK
jgi:TPR repeat protein